MLAREVHGSPLLILSTLDVESVEEAVYQDLVWAESDCPGADDNFTLTNVYLADAT